MEQSIIGRDVEKEMLRKLLNSGRPELIAVYGRRRVGKTFLVNEYFQDKGIYCEITGSRETNDATHLARFCTEISYRFYNGKKHLTAGTWEAAFNNLKTAIDAVKAVKPEERIILFFDELPWIDKAGSGFLGSLDYFWNRFFSRSGYKQVKIILCGSAASWIIKKIINSKGGLHNRVTHIIRLQPFTLEQSRQYLQSRGINLDKKQIIELYLCVGGIPLYLSMVERGESASQTVNRLCFRTEGFLAGEFDRLYSSLFDNHRYHIKIIRALASANNSLTRNELLSKANLPNSGNTTIAVRELEEAGFVMRMPTFGRKRKETAYRIIDEYSMFYLDWIEPVRSKIVHNREQNWWLQNSNTAAWNAWAGYAFESLCLKHIAQIKAALGISGVLTFESSWRNHPKNQPSGQGAQIDLIIDRADRTINLCEIKYARDAFTISPAYADQLKKRIALFRQTTGTRKHLFQTFITTHGVTPNDSYSSVVDNQITMDALFDKSQDHMFSGSPEIVNPD